MAASENRAQNGDCFADSKLSFIMKYIEKRKFLVQTSANVKCSCQVDQHQAFKIQ